MELNKKLAIAALAGVMSLTGFAAAQAEEAAAPAESNGCNAENSCNANSCEANSCEGKDAPTPSE